MDLLWLTAVPAADLGLIEADGRFEDWKASSTAHLVTAIRTNVDSGTGCGAQQR